MQRNRIAFDRGEIHPGLRAVAAPISDSDGVTIAAVGMWTTAARWEGASAELASAVVGTGRRMEAALRTAGRAYEERTISRALDGGVPETGWSAAVFRFGKA